MIWVDVVTIFPDYLGPLDLSLIGKARGNGHLELAVHDLRRWTHDVHRTVDDTPYGGGPGMVMRPSRGGRPWTSWPAPPAPGRAEPGRGAVHPGAWPHDLAGDPHLLFACGRYEGIDQRVIEHAATRMRVSEVSLGDYVLFGGEVAVLVMWRRSPGCCPGSSATPTRLSRSRTRHGPAGGTVYTKPPTWRGLECPTCCAPATTAGSPAGGGTKHCGAPPSGARTSCRAADRLDKQDRAVLAEPDFRSRPRCGKVVGLLLAAPCARGL